MARTRRRWRLWVGSGLVAIALLGADFLVFANAATRPPAELPPKADGIVALTGTQERISVAAQLLARERARRLLVTGINRQATSAEIRRLTGLDASLFDCCVDLGYEAQNTIGNAEETRAWAEQHEFSRLIVVTSSYHMPRSLVELGRVMPGVELIPYPVVSGPLRRGEWWTRPALIRLLASEYVKFLPSAARFALARLVHTLEPNAVATAQSPARS